MRMIFHLPYEINHNRSSGCNIRPLKMIDGFRKIGYKVDIIEGFAFKRKKNIEKIKDNIRNGLSYDFVYSESSVYPTLLTEKHHIPTNPFLDFNFFKFCKKNKIKIGLFYRDIYWNIRTWDEYKFGKFELLYRKNFHYYDLYKYNNLVNVLYLPSLKMKEYIPYNIKIEVKNLYPGLNENSLNEYDNDEIKNIIYVGGIGKLYNLEFVIQTINKLHHYKLTICCRKKDWNRVKGRYTEYLSDNINVVHKSGDNLAKLYRQSDIAIMYFQPNKFRNFAMPIKIFEYMEYNLPIIVTRETQAAKFIEKNKIGWSIPYNKNELNGLLSNYSTFKKEYLIYKNNILKIKKYHTWKERAKKVAKDLKK